jgi:hypothetical protein
MGRKSSKLISEKLEEHTATDNDGIIVISRSIVLDLLRELFDLRRQVAVLGTAQVEQPAGRDTSTAPVPKRHIYY